ncbi:hypothetical protein CC80DRAFT_550778 [Byssothecium circinans]|uniref:Rhodopsin domain-containing protein n=1 Tax=Byssothecium circinans TaxID=147558 RepID=A0A6A5TMA1_9PLEO|nr:hypothetical protein CC80DRAFT_550778 [Byssothecium circinans]
MTVLCIVAALGSIYYTGIRLASLNIGYGKHLWEIRAVTITRAHLLRMNQLSTLYIVAVGFAKLSVLLLYLRFFQIMMLSRRLIWLGMALTIASPLSFLNIEIVQTTQCVRLDSFNSPSFCTQMPNVVVAQAAKNVFLDFYILVIPLQQVLRLQLETRKKLGIAALFGIGSSACVVSAVRLAFTVMHMHEPDQFWSAILTSELSIVEMNVLIIAPYLLFFPACISTTRPGLSSLRSRLLSRSRLAESEETSIRVDYNHVKGDAIKCRNNKILS